MDDIQFWLEILKLYFLTMSIIQCAYSMFTFTPEPDTPNTRNSNCAQTRITYTVLYTSIPVHLYTYSARAPCIRTIWERKHYVRYFRERALKYESVNWALERVDRVRAAYYGSTLLAMRRYEAVDMAAP